MNNIKRCAIMLMANKVSVVRMFEPPIPAIKLAKNKMSVIANTTIGALK